MLQQKVSEREGDVHTLKAMIWLCALQCSEEDSGEDEVERARRG